MAEGWTPLSVRSGQASIAEVLQRPMQLGSAPGLADQALLIGQLATLVKAGLPVDRSLDLLRDTATKRTQSRLLGQLLASVRAGESLGKAMQQHEMLPQWAIGIIRSAEQGGMLGDALRAVAARLEEAAQTRQRLITALTYPAAVLIATIAALIIVLTSVVPQFEPVFAGSEDRLPRLTQLVLAASQLVRDDSLLLLAMLLGAPVAIWFLMTASHVAPLRARIVPFLPGIRLYDQIVAARFTGLLGTLTGNGVTLVRALPLARRGLSSSRWRSAMQMVENRVREGERLSSVLRSVPIFPLTATRLIEVGERTGSFAATCNHAAEIMGSAANARIERFVSLANPVATILLGGVIAAMVAGVMLGIFALGDFAA
ncbi:MAG: type II secretion system F family protein [Blastomonas sp.]